MSGAAREQGGDAATAPLVEDVFVTDCFLIKGRLANKFQRLARMLEDYERSYLSVEDAVLASLRGPEVIRTPRVLINQNELVFAHELIDVAGDDAQRRLAANEKSVRIRGFYNGSVQMELSGNVEPGAYEPRRGNRRNYFIMTSPVVRGLDFDGNPELAILRRLSYAIVRKDKLAYIYDFSDVAR
ncbi:MAG TPA: hypothetical protein VK081_03510 [Planctomycetota bacterium]|nr:hypothetical protein [Planctomycetota bacterium]